jgi:hypothetical protein
VCRRLILPRRVRLDEARGLLSEARICGVGCERLRCSWQQRGVDGVEEKRVEDLEDDIHGGCWLDRAVPGVQVRKSCDSLCFGGPEHAGKGWIAAVAMQEQHKIEQRTQVKEQCKSAGAE